MKTEPGDAAVEAAAVAGETGVGTETAEVEVAESAAVAEADGKGRGVGVEIEERIGTIESPRRERAPIPFESSSIIELGRVRRFYALCLRLGLSSYRVRDGINVDGDGVVVVVAVVVVVVPSES